MKYWCTFRTVMCTVSSNTRSIEDISYFFCCESSWLIMSKSIHEVHNFHMDSKSLYLYLFIFSLTHSNVRMKDHNLFLAFLLSLFDSKSIHELHNFDIKTKNAYLFVYFFKQNNILYRMKDDDIFISFFISFLLFRFILHCRRDLHAKDL